MRSDYFKSHVLKLFNQDMQTSQDGNYSYERFSFDGVDRSMTFDAPKHAKYLEWFVREVDQVFQAYVTLADDESRELYIKLLRYKLAGHLHGCINARVADLGDERARFFSAFTGTQSELTTTGMFGGLLHYDNWWNGIRYTVDTVKDGLMWPLVNRQYYFDRHGIRVQPEPGDHVIDGGAFTGDSTIAFSRSIGPEGFIYAFDPVQDHFDICSHNVSRPEYQNVRVFGRGLSDRNGEGAPARLEQYSPGWNVSKASVPLSRVDDLVTEGVIKRVDFIKLDVEGSEMATLRGAVASLRMFRPRLAISIYHKPNDFFEVLRFVADLKLGYRFFLDHYTIWEEETVLYALA